MECRIATLQEVSDQFDWLIETSTEKDNWITWKNRALERVSDGVVIPYYGFEDEICICEAYAVLSKDEHKSLTSYNKVYLKAFRTRPEYRNKGYFSQLYKFMMEDLKAKGYRQFTIGVESTETKNKKIYKHWGFDKLILKTLEIYIDGSQHTIEYYLKSS